MRYQDLNSQNFLIPYESFPVRSKDYLEFARYFKRKEVEGHWSSGCWIPPATFYYVNAHHINLIDSETSKNQTLSLPKLRDLEWEKGFTYEEARGFSGFTEDKEFTCNLDFEETGKDEATGKIFINPYDYLRKDHKQDLGKPLYHNASRNIVDIEARGTGKSFFGSGCIAHNFLTDGSRDYDLYLEKLKKGNLENSQTLIGSTDANKNVNLAKFVLIGLQNLVGEREEIENGSKVLYPSPISKKYSGVLDSKTGGILEAIIRVKEGESWKEVGSRSKIFSRIFENNETAANGTRPSLVCLEEVGFMGNLLEVLGALGECVSLNLRQFGVIWMFGTGGQMKTGQTRAVKEVFYNPQKYNCLSFEDIYENSGKKIGLFIPSRFKLNHLRDDKGFVDQERAKKEIENVRKKVFNELDSDGIDLYKQNNPEVPSEAFLEDKNNVFPTSDLLEQLNLIESDTTGKYIPQLGTLTMTDNVTVRWNPDLGNTLKQADYPVNPKKKPKGAIAIWEHPIFDISSKIPVDLYVASCDPYDHDQADNSNSLGSFFVYKTISVNGGTYEQIVCEYTGRPNTAAEFYENCRRICIYYNAKVLHENATNNIKSHFTHQKSLMYMADTPTILNVNLDTSKNRGSKGIHMTSNIKNTLVIEVRNYLLELRGDGQSNISVIYSVGLLKELISYNNIENFDRAISFFLLILHRNQVLNSVKKRAEGTENRHSAFIKKMKRYGE
jgi:hypothetical protein